MKHVRRLIPIVVLFCAVGSSLCRGGNDDALSGRELLRAVREKDRLAAKPPWQSRTNRSKADKEHPTAMDLLDKFAATQQELRSFTAKSDVLREGRGTFSKNVILREHSSFDSRVDETRVCVRSYIWGDVNPKMHLTKDKAYYQSHLWDGKDFYQYNRARIKNESSKGNLLLTPSGEDRERPRRASTFKYFPASIAMGHLPLEVERVDSIIRKADSVLVQDKMEKVGDCDCYVIEATGKTGNYKIWIDPAHGYNIAKAQVNKGPGDKLGNGYVLPENDNVSVFVTDVRFRSVDNLWVPIEARFGQERRFPKGDYYTQTSHYKITEFILNPDHEKLGSFRPDDILNGARVMIINANTKRDIPIRCTWQDGHVVDEKGQKVDYTSDEPADANVSSTDEGRVEPRKMSEPVDKVRVLHFPKDYVVGQIHMRDSSIAMDLHNASLEWGHVREAIGDIEVPQGKAVRLHPYKIAWLSGWRFSSLKGDDIQLLCLDLYPDADDSVMKDIGRLTGLEGLELAYCDGIETGLRNLTGLTKLKYLQLPCQIRNRELAHLVKLPSLQFLNSYGPMVTDAKMVQIGKLSSLTELNIGGGKVGEGLAYLKGLTSLRSLSLGASEVGEGLAYLKGLTSLRVLILGSSRDYDIDRHLVYIGQLKQLEELDLQCTTVGDAGLAHLTGLEKLKKLNLIKVPVTHEITDAGMVYLKNLKSLEELDLPYEAISDTGLGQLAELSSLKRIKVVGRGITDKGLASLAKIKTLEEIYVGGKNITDAGMAELARCHSLRSLTLNARSVTDAGLSQLAKIKSLTKLWIGKTKITGKGLAALKELPHLTRLRLYHLNPGESGISNLAGLTGITSFELSLPYMNFGDDDLAQLSGMSSLKFLSVTQSDASRSSITDDGLAHLSSLTALETLNLSTHCENVTDTGLRRLEGLTSLKYLRLDHSRITMEGVERLKKKVPGVTVTSPCTREEWRKKYNAIIKQERAFGRRTSRDVRTEPKTRSRKPPKRRER